ncbi:hypothetical protein [Rhodococcus sp. WMMA185]|uniref:hypothetical protein n=1 Tax=Rhodococcus sp. WMMA185 TaxID=679318 RepID=UPI0012F4CE19|nr:hypothetical protein [Rhodococcus sp. WMMA185]
MSIRSVTRKIAVAVSAFAILGVPAMIATPTANAASQYSVDNFGQALTDPQRGDRVAIGGYAVNCDDYDCYTYIDVIYTAGFEGLESWEIDSPTLTYGTRNYVADRTYRNAGSEPSYIAPYTSATVRYGFRVNYVNLDPARFTVRITNFRYDDQQFTWQGNLGGRISELLPPPDTTGAAIGSAILGSVVGSAMLPTIMPFAAAIVQGIVMGSDSGD